MTQPVDELPAVTDPGAGTITLTEAGIARAQALAEALDQGMADRTLAAEGEPGLIEIGISAIIGQVARDPQSVIDDNLSYLLLILDCLAYVTEGSAPTPRLVEWTGGHLTA